MSNVSQTIDENNFKGFDYDLSKIFIWNNRYAQATFKNNTGGELAFAAGTLLARDSSDNSIVPLDSTTATNGVHIPIGVLAEDVASLADAGTVANINFCTGGDVARDKVLFQGSDDFDVVASGTARTIEDLMLSQDIRAVEGQELTKSDNS